MLEPLYKPLYRFTYPLNLVGYGLEFYNLPKDNGLTVLAMTFTSLSLARTILFDVQRFHETRTKQGDVFWETIEPYNFRKESKR